MDFSILKSLNLSICFAPDSSVKLRGFEIYFFLRWQSDWRKLLLTHKKKRIQDENLQRIAGIGTLLYLFLKKQ